MTERVGKLVTYSEAPESDGSHFILVEVPDAGQVPVRLSEQGVQRLVLALQRGLLARYEKLAEAPQFPLFEVVGVGTGHGETHTGLWVETAQSGVWGLYGSPEILTDMKRQIDRAMELSAAREKAKQQKPN